MQTKVYGHRGAMGKYPENTMLAFNKAVEMGVDGLEIDVHLTKDKKVVVMHDTSLDRTTKSSGLIKEKKLYDIQHIEISQAYNTFEEYDSTWDKERIPLLTECLTMYKDEGVDINIELKTGAEDYPGIEEEIYHIISPLDMLDKVVLSSVNLDTLVKLKKLDKNLRVAFLSKQVPENPKAFIEEYGLEALHLSVAAINKSTEDLSEIAQSLRVWVVNDEENARKLFDMGVGAVMTDYPDKVLKIRSDYYC